MSDGQYSSKDILARLLKIHHELRDKDPLKDIPRSWICCIQDRYVRLIQDQCPGVPLEQIVGRSVWITSRYPFTDSEQVMAYVDPRDLSKYDTEYAAMLAQIENERRRLLYGDFSDPKDSQS